MISGDQGNKMDSGAGPPKPTVPPPASENSPIGRRMHIFETGVISGTTAATLVAATLMLLTCFAQFRYQLLVGDSRVFCVELCHFRCHAQLHSFDDDSDRRAWLATLGKVITLSGWSRTFAFGGSTWHSPAKLYDIERVLETGRTEPRYIRGEIRSLELLFPLWVPVLLFSAIGDFLLWRGPVRRHQRHRRGRCWRCGYVLSGSPGQVCPECGGFRSEPPASLRTVLVVCAGSALFLAGVVALIWIPPLLRTRTPLGAHYARETETPTRPPTARLEDVVNIARERAAMALQIDTQDGYLPAAESCILLDPERVRYEIRGTENDKSRCPKAPVCWIVIMQIEAGPSFRPVYMMVGDEVMLDDRGGT